MIENKEPEFKFGLGDKVEDELTGFVGVVVCRSQWINACNTYAVQSTELKDGVPQKRQHFDEPQLMSVEKNVASSDRKTGGPERPVPQSNR